jgi:DNA-binding transcriptional LysR family regulator
LRIGVGELHREVSGELKMGASDNLCNYLLPILFDEVFRSFPKIKIKLFSGSSADIQNEMLADRLELGLFYTKVLRSRDFEVNPLRFVEFVVVSKKELKIKDLMATPYIGSRRADYRGSSPALEMLQSLGVSPNTILETNNQETQKKMALIGCGFTVVPLHMVEQELAERSLFRVQTTQRLGSTVSIIKRRGKTTTRPAEVFEKILLSRFL